MSSADWPWQVNISSSPTLVDFPTAGRDHKLGGLSFFSTRQGFIYNNVLSFQIILANGSITTATSTSNSDVQRALRGGSNNFSIVTHYELATFALQEGPFKPLWGRNVY